MKNYYEILEVNPKATQEMIEKTYKFLVKKYHPDLYSSIEKMEAEKKLKEINEAYNILSDSFLRSQYDKSLEQERIKEEQQRINQYNNVINNYGENTQNNNEGPIKEPPQKEKKNRNNVGTIFGIAELIKQLWENLPKEKRKEKKQLEKKDWLAILLTIITMIIIGIILWFIPFTNAWMRQLLFENPLFNFIGKIFTKSQ